MNSKGGWGTGKLQIDFSITVQHANASTPMKSFTKTSDFYSPDCDSRPVAGAGRRRHRRRERLRLHRRRRLPPARHPRTQQKLYEMWRANIIGRRRFNGGCLAVWDLTKRLRPHVRGEGCTSADAGGFPMTALLVRRRRGRRRARSTTPSASSCPTIASASGIYVHPATHADQRLGVGDGAELAALRRALAPARRLPVASLPSAGAKVVARALQKYGMFLVRRRQHRADGDERQVHHAQVVGAARVARSRRAQDGRLRHGRRRHAHSARRLRSSVAGAFDLDARRTPPADPESTRRYRRRSTARTSARARRGRCDRRPSRGPARRARRAKDAAATVARRRPCRSALAKADEGSPSTSARRAACR